MKVKNPIVFWLLIVFIVGNIFDSITTFFVLPGEANPIFLLTGSVWALLGFKLLMILSIWWFYFKGKFNTHFSYYNYILVLVMANMFLIFAASSNIFNLVTVAPEVIAAQSQVTAEVKIKSYAMVTGLMYLLPYAMSLLSFYLYDKSNHHIKFKEDNWVRIKKE